MKRKTYGVSGLMDWTTQIKAGKAMVTVHFTGGALTAYGVTPATYSTTDAFFQRVIEGSAQFRSGKIALLSEMEVGGNPGAADAARTVAKDKATVGVTDAAHTVAKGEAKGEAENGDEDGTVVEVPDRYDAVVYLKEHFPDKGYTSTALRTKAAFDAACRAHGVRFVFTTENDAQ
ncbi:MAG: hypothetical protein SOY69_00510 [Alloprevotella sp.]|nr:hypothetical protein [Alloprevotella sp.]